MKLLTKCIYWTLTCFKLTAHSCCYRSITNDEGDRNGLPSFPVGIVNCLHLCPRKALHQVYFVCKKFPQFSNLICAFKEVRTVCWQIMANLFSVGEFWAWWSESLSQNLLVAASTPQLMLHFIWKQELEAGNNCNVFKCYSNQGQTNAIVIKVKQVQHQ